MRQFRRIVFAFLSLFCLGQVAFSAPPPVRNPPQPPVQPPPVFPAVKKVVLRVGGKSGEKITSVTDTAGCLVRLTFTYDGEGGAPANDWSPERRYVVIKALKQSKKSGRFVIYTSLIGKIHRIGKNRYEMVAPLRQSIRPGDYLIEAKLGHSKGFGGVIAATSLKVDEPQFVPDK